MELHLWVMPVRGRTPLPALEKALRPFRRENPGVDVRVEGVPWGSAWDRIMSALKGRRGAPAPDVLHLDAAWTGTLAHMGFLHELTPLLDDLDREDALPALWEPGYLPHGRRLFSVPWTLDVRVFRCRPAALEETGLSTEALFSWEGLKDLSRRAASLRRRLLRPRPGGEGLLADLAPWVWAAGGDFFSADERSPAFLEPAALEAFSFFRDLLVAGGDGRGEAVLEIDSLDESWAGAAVPLPRGPAGRFTCLAGGALGVAAGSRCPEESARLIRHLCAAPSQRAFARDVGLLPPRVPSEDAGRALHDALASLRVPPPLALLGSFERLFHRHLSPVVQRAAPWSEWRAALDRAARETELLLTHLAPS